MFSSTPTFFKHKSSVLVPSPSLLMNYLTRDQIQFPLQPRQDTIQLLRDRCHVIKALPYSGKLIVLKTKKSWLFQTNFTCLHPRFLGKEVRHRSTVKVVKANQIKIKVEAPAHFQPVVNTHFRLVAALPTRRTAIDGRT